MNNNQTIQEYSKGIKKNSSRLVIIFEEMDNALHIDSFSPGKISKFDRTFLHTCGKNK